MATAPEPYLTACLEVLTEAILGARRIGWEGQYHGGLSVEAADELADLMDAVHNIPIYLNHWERCDESMIRKFLERWEDKWTGKGTTRHSLIRTYQRALQKEEG